MLGLSRTVTANALACALAIGLLSLAPSKAQAQYNNIGYGQLGVYGGQLGYVGYPPIAPPIAIIPPNQNQNAGGVTRATSSLANPLNFYQYGQVTGVGPIRGTVRIYNQFGLLGQDQNSGGLGGSLVLGANNLNNQQLPGQGNTQGDDPPQGVLLHVNYAQMFLPNQQQINGG